MKHNRFFFIGVLLIIISFLFGMGVNSYRISKRPIEVRRDTTFVFDTIKVASPMPIQTTKVVRSRVPIPIFFEYLDTLTLRDTTYVVLDREQKYYKGENYEAWVSGYGNPSLDNINVFTKTRTITNTIQPKKNYLEATISADFSKFLTLPISVTYGKNYKYLSTGVGISYEPLYKNFSVFAEVSIPLWCW